MIINFLLINAALIVAIIIAIIILKIIIPKKYSIQIYIWDLIPYIIPTFLLNLITVLINERWFFHNYQQPYFWLLVIFTSIIFFLKEEEIIEVGEYLPSLAIVTTIIAMVINLFIVIFSPSPTRIKICDGEKIPQGRWEIVKKEKGVYFVKERGKVVVKGGCIFLKKIKK